MTRTIAVVALLLVCCGASATTLDFEAGFVDSEGTTWSVDSGVATSATQAHGGTWSAYFNGTNKTPMWTTDGRYIGAGANDFELSLWMYPTGGGVNCIWGTGATKRSVLYFDNADKKLRFYDQDSGAFIAETGASVVLNTWQMVTVRRVGSTLSMWHNTTQIASAIVAGPMMTGPDRFVLGGEYLQYDQPFVGYIDDVYFSWFGEASPTPPVHSPVGVEFAGSGRMEFRGPTTRSGIDDQYTKSLLHYDGGLLDESGKPWIVYGAYSAATPGKFGSGCASGSAAVDNMRSAVSADWYFPGDFTIDAWFKPITAGPGGLNKKFIWYQIEGGGVGFGFYVLRSAGVDSLVLSADGIVEHSAPVTLAPGAWTHLAASVSGSTYYLFQDGSLLDSGIIEARSYLTGNVGTGLLLQTLSADWPCNIDELRVSKGIARWTSAFTPPTAAYVAGRQGWVALR